MTNYQVSALATSSGSGTFAIGLRAGARQIQIDRIEFRYGSTPATNGLGFYTLTDYTGGSFSGGSSVTPLVMRKGGPSALATCRAGMGTTASGTSDFITSVQISANSTANYSFPYKYLLASADGFFISSPASGAGFSFEVVIFFQEMRLARSN